MILFWYFFGAGGGGTAGSGSGRGSGSGDGSGVGAHGDGSDTENGIKSGGAENGEKNSSSATSAVQPSPGAVPKGEKDLIYIQKERVWNFASEQLSVWFKDKNSVKFPDFGSDGVTVNQISDGRWQVEGYFTAEDDRRRNFSVTVKVYGDDMYRAEELKLK
ncbi:MAG: hypothetical protein RR060_02895 [Victivallaceae bacterium]